MAGAELGFPEGPAFGTLEAERKVKSVEHSLIRTVLIRVENEQRRLSLTPQSKAYCCVLYPSCGWAGIMSACKSRHSLRTHAIA